MKQFGLFGTLWITPVQLLELGDRTVKAAHRERPDGVAAKVKTKHEFFGHSAFQGKVGYQTD